LPRDGIWRNPPFVFSRLAGFCDGADKPRRAKAEKTRPAARTSLGASSLAARERTPLGFNVIALALMLWHQIIKVKRLPGHVHGFYFLCGLRDSA
jgi:hypothetical protein